LIFDLCFFLYDLLKYRFNSFIIINIKELKMKKLIAFVSTMMMVLLAAGASFLYSAIPQEEREALIALYKATNGDKWKDNSGWKEEPLESDDFGPFGSEGNWKGITVSGNHVTKIEFSANNLEGILPPGLGNFTYLEELFIRDSVLSGNLPPEIGKLNNLKVLRLECFILSGSLPQELGQLTNLKELDIHSNELTGRIPAELGNLSNLETLKLDIPNLEGSIPPELGNLSNLKTLQVGSLYVLPSGGADVKSDLSTLAGINYSSGGSIPPELGKLNNLKELILNYTDLSGSIPSQLGNLSNLEILRLNHNQLTGMIPPELGNLLNLKELDLSGNRFNEIIPPELGKLTSLQRLRLFGSHLIGSIPAEMGNLTDVQDIDLSYNQLEGRIPPELGNLTNLQHLWLQYNQLSGSIPPGLGSLPRLQQLQLQGNRLSGSIPINLTGLHVYLLDISYNSLYAVEPGVRLWLDRLQSAWLDTQTTAPTNVSAVSNSSSSIKVSWTPIKYKEDKGGYEVYYSTTPRGPWVDAGMTTNKLTSSFEITDLSPGKQYYFVVQTQTDPHIKNKNTVVSEYSKVVFAKTK